MMLPVWINPDLSTIWGTPWESTWTQNYLVCQKAGVAGNYAGILGVVPELELGIAFQWSYELAGSASDYVSQTAWNALIPAFVQALIPLQPLLASPPNPFLFTGNYTFDGDVIQIIAVPSIGYLLLRTDLLGSLPTLTFPTTFVGNNTLQITWPVYVNSTVGGLATCTEMEELAIIDEYVTFVVPNGGGHATSLMIPYFLSGVPYAYTG